MKLKVTKLKIVLRCNPLIKDVSLGCRMIIENHFVRRERIELDI